MLATQFSFSSTMKSDSGWTDNELCEIWFRECFIPNVVARRVDNRKPIVLTFDGHESHETPAIKRLAYEKDIVLFCLPSKTTHKLQPLDVGVFSVLQYAWNKHCGDLATKGITIDRYNFIPEYLDVRKKAITPQLIIKAFRKTGISPFNPSIFSDNEYRPSMASSSTLHLPPSFPNHIPTSPPAIPTDDSDSDDDFILGRSSDAEVYSGDEEGLRHSEGYGCEDEEDVGLGCDGSGHEGMPNDQMRPTPLLDSNVPHTTPTYNQHITDGAPPERSIPISQPATFIPLDHTGFSPPNHPPAFSTRSHMSLAAPHSSVSPSNIPVWEKSFEDVVAENGDLQHKLFQSEAALKAAEAHCSILAQALTNMTEQLTNVAKKKTRGTSKIKARWVALPELKDAFEAEEASREAAGGATTM